MFPGVDANRKIRNIALTGFMGCGKTAVGRVVAKVAGFEFLDTDQFIEEHVGKTIPRIFEEHGEETFRRYEREVVVRLAERENTVIATGGGLLVDAENMDTMKQYAMVFCLWASPAIDLASRQGAVAPAAAATPTTRNSASSTCSRNANRLTAAPTCSSTPSTVRQETSPT